MATPDTHLFGPTGGFANWSPILLMPPSFVDLPHEFADLGLRLDQQSVEVWVRRCEQHNPTTFA
jgi:hypothetical protein